MKSIPYAFFASQAVRIGAACGDRLRRVTSRGAILILLILVAVGLAAGQMTSKPKVPVIDKIGSGISRQAFSGIVQSLDEKRNILNVSAVEGGVTEIFPVKKGTTVSTVDGARRKLSDLVPGTNVIVYFELRADHRTVKRIEVLARESKKQAPPS